MEEKSITFQNILKLVEEKFNNDIFEQIKTKNGNTQHVETSYKLLIKNILIENNYNFKEAGTQQPYDFRISMLNGETLNLELKKTDGYRICFNDTCPNSEAYYIIIYTAKKSKNYKPQIIGVNGNTFIENCPWIEDYIKDLNIIKQKYSSMKGNMYVYPRPNLSSDIKFLLLKSQECNEEPKSDNKLKRTKNKKNVNTIKKKEHQNQDNENKLNSMRNPKVIKKEESEEEIKELEEEEIKELEEEEIKELKEEEIKELEEEEIKESKEEIKESKEEIKELKEEEITEMEEIKFTRRLAKLQKQKIWIMNEEELENT